ncbi:MAG: ATP synthase F1 subunit epsilon [Candidatus Levybacteria bacterium RIFCSPLOWO2_01_FULL_38_13]|uniref:ATP synthase epsilon chain n=1 Tax=Candidatus Roizmanbacteria bacterium RIFCSPHIGHO2_12_FULL_33_9 TaxID=1802045 RepID=A0A1F7HJX0_9BACT|nr:MAG: ATP synthase F1 subunit epsilon [Candidatus Levybacteria bacterium RIFCSPHIGHO2_01_FULL_41_15]OGH35340.1 MAG: ATP synthase F1 subunit epsilon [Candidatus Levybacteria bacterium RIFCSPLOWO2_01_FULL_38_13]OGK31296.1 MAG: ATP synthase F1 subunit epsilon [Candidatus Roizmanbacteria bacterium RIFCSPHIGHO2_12_FULL_33_9]
MNLHLEIITPEKIVYKNDVDEVVVQSENGQITILPNHVGLLTKIVPGELIVKKGGSTQLLAITGGFLEVEKNNVSILADYAVRAEDIEVLKAQEAQRRAGKLMEEKRSEKDFATAQAEMIKAITELKVATKYKRKPSRPTEV